MLAVPCAALAVPAAVFSAAAAPAFAAAYSFLMACFCRHREKRLEPACGSDFMRSAKMTIYGGDCVISADGTLRIIDFNDWPSFARCREEAGGKIAECIYKRAKKQMK